MKKNLTLFLIFLLVLAGGYYYLFFKKSKEVKAPESKSEFDSQATGQVNVNKEINSQTKAKPTPSPGVTKSEAVFSPGEESLDNAADIQVVEIVFTGELFSPTHLTIKANDWVFFKNTSSGDFWPILISGKDGAPDFGSKTSVLSNKSYKYQFQAAGIYEIGEKNFSQAKAVIIVK